VAFAVEADAIKETPKTGDDVGANMILWIALMVASFAAIMVLVVNRRKFIR
jgi:LPXTG-motif cell wall-anchored protein